MDRVLDKRKIITDDLLLVNAALDKLQSLRLLCKSCLTPNYKTKFSTIYDM
jgi:hypothetical protein